MGYSYLKLHFNRDLRLIKAMYHFDSLHTIYINHTNKEHNEKSVLNLLYQTIYICHIKHHFSKIQVFLYISSKDDRYYISVKKILLLITSQLYNLYKDHIYTKNNDTRIINHINQLAYIDHNKVHLSILGFYFVAQ